MGACLSSPQLRQERQNHKIAEEKIKESELNDSQILKLLLLGPGSSGKSTLLKQMIKIYGTGFSESDRRFYTPIIYHNVVDAMKLLVSNSHKFGTLHPMSEEAKRVFLALKTDGDNITITQDFIAPQIRILWGDKCIKDTYEHGTDFHLTESCKYFFDKIDEIAAFGYLPSEADLLRVRAPTTGIVETTFTVEKNTFKMLDVGGQRSERRKWIHCFENVTAVLFVSAISEYNQVLFEDETTNRLVESYTLFGEMCNSKWFRRTSMILFLNKRDIFAEKIKHVPFTDYFPEYVGPNTYDDLCVYIEGLFLARNANSEEKKIYTHITCATDTNNIRAVFFAVKNIIIRKNLQRFGLL